MGIPLPSSAALHNTRVVTASIACPGYGMTGDLHSLMATSAAFRDVGKQLCAFVDLLTIHKQVRIKRQKKPDFPPPLAVP